MAAKLASEGYIMSKSEPWQWHLMRTLRQTLATDPINDLADICFKKCPDGLLANVQKDNIPSQYQSMASYIETPGLYPSLQVQCLLLYSPLLCSYTV